MNRNRELWRPLIAVEGIDGAGTTTLTARLAHSFARSGLNHAVGCEPTDGEIGRLIRRGLSGSPDLKPETMALLFSADRREHLFAEGGIASVIASGGIYITDRYFFSSLAYQSLDASWEWVDALNADYPLPGYLILLSLPVSEAMGRLKGRESRDIYETADQQKRVSEGYRRAVDQYRECGIKLLELDSRRPPDALLRESLRFLDDPLNSVQPSIKQPPYSPAGQRR